MPIITALEDLKPSSDLLRHPHIYIYIYAQTYTNVFLKNGPPLIHRVGTFREACVSLRLISQNGSITD